MLLLLDLDSLVNDSGRIVLFVQPMLVKYGSFGLIRIL